MSEAVTYVDRNGRRISFTIPIVGEIWRSPNGLLRIARVVRLSNRRNPNKMRVYFTIRHCSWTHRCYTLYTVAELLYNGYVNTHKKWRWLPEDIALNDIIERNHELDRKKALTCCDVEGIA